MKKIFTGDEMWQMTLESRVRSMAQLMVQIGDLGDRPTAVSEWPFRLDALISDAHHRSAALNGIMLALAEADQTQAALDTLELALNSARLAGYDSVIDTVNSGMGALAAIGQDDSLKWIYELVKDIEDWFDVV